MCVQRKRRDYFYKSGNETMQSLTRLFVNIFCIYFLNNRNKY